MNHKLALLAIVGSTAGLVSLSCTMQQTSGLRASGQSKLMDDTFAGQNACNPDDHNRPFIIEWDATDMSSFESLATSDIVMVKYEGCKLRVLDECRNDNVRGSQGAYKPPEWTSGSLETLDIHNEGELYAKLPLGQASLGGRVSGGERFHMEYFVAGTVYATRDAVYRNDLDSNPGCDDATHFVYGYNLGAFALGSANELETKVGGSIYGFGAGGGHSEGRTAEKKGGDLGACRGDSATEVMGCKTPIRLNLREIRDGESPESEAMAAPDDAASMSAAAVVNTKIEMSDEARAHFDAAQQKLIARDGKGCLGELDAHDALDPDHKSSDPKSGLAIMRSQCVMLAGKCDAGKDLARRGFENTNMANYGAEHIDRAVEAQTLQFCQGSSMSKREQLLQALNNLQMAAFTSKKDSAYCTEQWGKIKKLAPKVEPRDDDDTQIIHLERNLYAIVPKCYEKAGDCKGARKAWAAVLPRETREGFDKIEDDKIRADVEQKNFEGLVGKCKGK